MVQQNQFGGSVVDDPNAHLAIFLEICDTIIMNGVPDEAIRLRLFPFSLRDKARQWLQTFPLGSITSWDDLTEKFMAKFFPPSKTLQLKNEIAQFHQFDFEPLYEAWERFKELLRRCPQHGYADWQKVQYFYNGMNGHSITIIDAAAGGTLMAKTPSEAMLLLEEMAANSYQWPSERSTPRNVAGVLELDTTSALASQISALSKQIATLNSSGKQQPEAVMEISQEMVNPDTEQVNYVNNRGFNNRGNQLPTHYHPGLRNHENFSYSNTRNVLQPPPGFQNQAKKALTSFINQSNAFMSDTRSRFTMQDTRMDKMELQLTQLASTMKNLENQMGQLATIVGGQQQKNQFSSTTEANSKEQCSAIHQRSGTGYEEKKILEKQESSEPNTDCVSIHSQIVFGLKKSKKRTRNTYPMHALEQMPNYAKFLKEVMSKKRKLAEFETVNLTEECSAIIQRKLPQKLKDPGSFTIHCVIGGVVFNKALCDLGASINLMPLSIFRKLGLGEVKPSTVTLQLADRSLTYPKGIVEYVLVKVDKFIFPMDFLVLDMEGDRDVPLILGRPFLATARALIDVQKGELTL
ncbi:hypothetical protein DH2020_040881 [Rehmannia glutinosa]|uniref:Retrotransposon gag domain-containing protein n=1 Tax=Rehmannia glutinosa TaxID=99300 RepID=A0ABR0USX9_REHGL